MLSFCFLVFSSGLSDASIGCCRRLIRFCGADELRPPRVDRRPVVVGVGVGGDVLGSSDCFSRSSKLT